MKAHWRVEKGERVNDALGACAATEKTTQGAGAAALITKAHESSDLVQ